VFVSCNQVKDSPATFDRLAHLLIVRDIAAADLSSHRVSHIEPLAAEIKSSKRDISFRGETTHAGSDESAGTGD
jgi:hypothetical protein